MKIKDITFILFLTILGLFSSCVDNNMRELLNKGDVSPETVNNVKVENLHGSVRLTYNLPQDRNLLYVEAKYKIREGVEREAKSSFYGDTIYLNGFAQSKSYSVKLYTVSKGGSKSEAVTVSVFPKKPPFKQVFDSLKLKETFGGISIEYNNSYKANIAIVILTQDSTTHSFIPLQTIYTKRKSGREGIFNLPSVSQEFKYYVRDQFQNVSDTGSVILTPFFEDELDKHKFSNAKLDGDVWESTYGALPQIWDGRFLVRNDDSHFTSIVTPLPTWFTIDLGQIARISRFIVTPRPHFAAYNRAYPKIFELWGSLNPNPNGNLDNTWFKYGTYITQTSHGGPPTDEDIENPVSQSFNIPDATNLPPVKYIRFKTVETWGQVNQTQICELTFYGQIE